MNSIDELKLLSEMKTISRLDLKCYVDSWTRPMSGEAKGDNARPCVYSFVAPNSEMVKIGSTCRPISRRYQLRNGPVSRYAPPDTHLGDYSHIEPCINEQAARQAEVVCHRILRPWRISARPDCFYNRNEWYDVSLLVAQRALIISAYLHDKDEFSMQTDDIRELINTL